MTSELTGARGSLETADGAVDIYRLDHLSDHGDIARLPKTVKILLENLLRRAGTRDVSDDDVRALAAWPGPARNIAFMPGRVLMQDLTGVPAVVDLAAMRSAMARNGGDPSKVDPLVPADLIIDHSVQVDLFRSEGAYAANIEWEYRRNAERYALLRWAQQAFDGLRVVPPGAGICHQVNLEHLGQVVHGARRGRVPRHARRDGLAHDHDQRPGRARVGRRRHRGRGGDARAADVHAAAARGRRADDREPSSRDHRDRPGAHAHADASRARRRRPVRRVLRRRAVHALHRRPRDACPTCVPSTAPPPRTSRSTPRRSGTSTFTGRGDLVDVVERYTKEQGLFRSDGDPDPVFTEVLDLDLSAIVPSLAGPKRPQDRVALPDVWESFVAAFRDGAEPDPNRRGRRFESEEGIRRRGRCRRDDRAGTETPIDVNGVTSARLGRDRRDHQLHEHVEPLGHAGRGSAREEGGRGRAGDEAVGEDQPGARARAS